MQKQKSIGFMRKIVSLNSSHPNGGIFQHLRKSLIVTGLSALSLFNPSTATVQASNSDNSLQVVDRAIDNKGSEAARFGENCFNLDLRQWRHKTRYVIENHKEVQLHWVKMCRNKTYPVFGVKFDYDPQGATKDFFHPLFREMIEANGFWPFSFIEVDDRLAIHVYQEKKFELLVDYEDLAAVASTDGAAPAIADKTPQTSPEPAEVPPQGVLIFDGSALTGLTPFAFNSADFATHARLDGDGLRIEWPKGQGWAKTGVATQNAPIVMPARGDAQVTRITARFDASQSSGFSLAFSPLDTVNMDPFKGNDMRLQLFHDGKGGGKVQLTQRVERNTSEARFAWPEGEVALSVLLRPDQVIEIRDDKGTQWAEFVLAQDFGGRAWALQAYLQVNSKNSAAQLLLKRIETDRVAFQPPVAIDMLALIDTEAKLFDGTALTMVWAPNERRSGHFARFARLADGALRVGWTPEDGGSYVGLATPEAVLWLDGFHGDAKARLDLELAGNASKDIEISLAGRYTLPGNLTSSGSYVLRLTRQEDGSYRALSHVRAQEEKGAEALGFHAVPDVISLILTPQGIRPDLPGMPEEPVMFPALKDGAGLRLSVLAIADREKAGAMVLSGISRSHHPATSLPTSTTAPGVAPLPAVQLFDGVPGQEWEGRSEGAADFSTLAQQGAGALTLMRRDHIPDWNRIALVGKVPMVELDYRLESTPYDLTIQMEPSDTLSTRVFLANSPKNFEKAARSALSVRVLDNGPDAGGLEVQLHTGHFSYDHWRRVLPAEWWKKNWQGNATLRLANGAVSVLLDDQLIMTGISEPTYRGAKYYLGIVPGGIGKTDGGSVTLRTIMGGWVTPEGMTEVDRWRLVDADSFDPDAFADLMATGLVE